MSSIKQEACFSLGFLQLLDLICGPQVNMSRLSMIYVDMKCSVIYYCDTKGGGGKTYERTDSVT